MKSARSKTSRPYHHGDLRNALLNEAEAILKREGSSAITLRAVARAAGVSHAAPANHFIDLTGLLSDLAALGYMRFAAALTAAADTHDGLERRLAVGRAYVKFARANPEMFALMFHSKALDPTRPALCEGIAAARTSLRAIASSPQGVASSTRAGPAVAQAAALWSIVHGFSALLIDGRLDSLVNSRPGRDKADQLFEEIMASIVLVTPDSGVSP